MSLLVASKPLSPFTRAKGRDDDLDIDIGPVMESVGSHLGFSRAVHGDENLGQPMGYLS